MEISLADCLEKYRTPCRLGRPVLTGSGVKGTFDSKAVDCPFVFFHNGQFYMMYVGFDGAGYQTGLAVSRDLIRWTKKGAILRRGSSGWDRTGAAGMTMLRAAYDLHGTPTLGKFRGRYWMVYHSYPEAGYETGPARIGLAWCEEESLTTWHRLPAPVMGWENGKSWESGGLYKGCLVENAGRFYLFYNAKDRASGPWHEQIGLAVSDDLTRWSRCPGNPVLPVAPAGGWDDTFCADPYVVRDGELWLMFYYGFNRRHAQEGLAVSHDFFHWEKCPGPLLPHGTQGALDSHYAHKPSILWRDGVLYHFYCACREFRPGDPAENLWHEFRCITLAASRPFPECP